MRKYPDNARFAIDGTLLILPGEFMKRLFCRPYGTNPGVHALCPSSKLPGYYQLSLSGQGLRDAN